MTTYLLIAVGGALGTLCRFGLGLLLAPVSQELPWGTIVINVLGSFVIGFFGTLTLASGRYPVSETTRLFVMVGICGGFTTFSSFALQTLDLLRTDAIVRGCLNVAISVALCLCAVAAGHAIAARLNGGAAQIAQAQLEEEA
ncbi:fluoride efflux transporter CrcB [Lichenibacterium dinghuense]|uniref:fluoride efflux transporter CrcB n=1 Tax=Lichenibacterium dinghuense TaxID=2895977 RepID=UPI001F32D1B4|nr:fluoride efflux transporter CrcB [Lichenibacterium sp. 6Y81]